MKNFTDFLTSMARGQDPDLGEMLKGRRRSGPPPVSLLPSEQAMSDMHEGAHATLFKPNDYKGVALADPAMANAERLANSPRLETVQPGTGLENPVGGVRGGAPKFNYGGAISGIAGGIADAAKPAPWINNTPNFSDDLAPRQIPRFARGGFLPLNQLGIVGDGGEEVIQPTADGVKIVPLSDEEKKKQRIAEGYRLLAEDGTPIPQDAPRTPITGRGAVALTQRSGQGSFDPVDTGYYPNGIKRQAMDERGPSGESIINPNSSDLERTTANPNYNPRYDTQVSQPGGVRYGGQPIGGDEQYGINQTINKMDTPNDYQAQWNQQNPNIGSAQSPDQPLQPNNRQSPLDEQLTQLYTTLNHYQRGEEYNPKTGDFQPIKKSKWKDIGSILAQSFNNAVNPQQAHPVVPWSDSVREEKMRPIIGQIGALEQQRKAGADEKYRTAQTENLYADNTRLEQERKDRADRTAQSEQIRRRANFRRGHPFFSADKATESDKRELAAFGETPESMGTYNFSKPDVHAVGGVTFKLNPNTGSYEDTGIPHDGSKALTEYTVQDADGVTYKYTTTNEKAAALKNQLVSAGLQIQAANARQASQQSFTHGENEANRALRLTIQSNAIAAQKALADYNSALSAGRTEEAQNHLNTLRKLREQDKAYNKQLEDAGMGTPVGRDLTQ